MHAQSNAKRIVLDSRAIAEQNARLLQLDPSVHDLEKFPQALAAADVRSWIGKLSGYPDEDLFDSQGRKLEKPDLDALIESTAQELVPASQPTRYGLVVRRADLRTFPSTLRAYDSADDRDIDRFQESALFPGTPVVIAHESRDKNWWFVVSPLYAAWVEKRIHRRRRGASDVFAYTRKSPYLVVTGATVKTVFTPTQSRGLGAAARHGRAGAGAAPIGRRTSR